MIDGLKPYPEMKPSGLPWLGDVPAHWEILRAKRLLKPIENPALPDDEIVTCFRDGQVTLRKNRRTNGFMLALFEQGISMSGPANSSFTLWMRSLVPSASPIVTGNARQNT